MEYNDERRVYELGYHMVPTLTEEELQKEVELLRSAISELNGTIVSEGEPNMIDLAYTMAVNEGGKNTKYDTSYFGWIKFDLEPKNIAYLKNEVIEDNKNIFRYLLIKTVAEDTQAKVHLEMLKEVENKETLTPVQMQKTEVVEDSIDEQDIIKMKEDLDKDIDSTIDKLLEE